MAVALHRLLHRTVGRPLRHRDGLPADHRHANFGTPNGPNAHDLGLSVAEPQSRYFQFCLAPPYQVVPGPRLTTARDARAADGEAP